MSEKNGLFMKYFVLKPKGDDIYSVASRKAMQIYANTIMGKDPHFAQDIRDWLGRLKDE